MRLIGGGSESSDEGNRRRLLDFDVSATDVIDGRSATGRAGGRSPCHLDDDDSEGAGDSEVEDISPAKLQDTSAALRSKAN